MTNLGVMMAGNGGVRRDHDFYATPQAETVINGLFSVMQPPPGPVWEPACGTGDMSQAINMHRQTFNTDLHDRGFGVPDIDFTTITRDLYGYVLEKHWDFDGNGVAPKSVITNPPFSLAEKFLETTMSLGFQYCALLLKTQWMNAKRRYPLFWKYPITGYFPLTYRLDFSGAGAPTMDLAWHVWYRGTGVQKIQPLVKM